ncbi:hypothetical protein [Rhizobium sp. FKL33]|uniref:hypothetical protein n=1 Tax=Rhizobium sp. FKL33 TaxID=2562307 RepID=UPI0010BF68EC|nr:hypothetical protein [Rhizobium sp. FKL33]
MIANEPAQMILIILAALAYGAVASGCVLKTLFEGYAARAQWDVWRILGLAVCFIWPLLFLAPLMQLVFRGKRGEKVGMDRRIAANPGAGSSSESLRSNG